MFRQYSNRRAGFGAESDVHQNSPYRLHYHDLTTVLVRWCAEWATKFVPAEYTLPSSLHQVSPGLTVTTCIPGLLAPEFMDFACQWGSVMAAVWQPNYGSGWIRYDDPMNAVRCFMELREKGYAVTMTTVSTSLNGRTMNLRGQ